MAPAPRLRVLTMAAIGAALLLVVSGCDWLQTGFDGGYSNANPYEPALTASTVGSLKQQYVLGSAPGTYGSWVVARGTVYAGTTGGVSAVHVSDGSPVWTTTLPAGAASTVAYDSGTVFAASGSSLYAIDARTGSIRWSDASPTNPNFGATEIFYGPTIDGGKLFVLYGNSFFDGITYAESSLSAIDETSGATLWTSSYLDSAYLPDRPIASGGSVYVSFTGVAGPLIPPTVVGPETAVYNEADGSGGPDFSRDSVYMAADGLVYESGTDKNGTSGTGGFDPTTGTFAWSQPGSGPTPVAVSADLFMTAGLTALDPHTGATKWTATLPAGTTQTSWPVIAGTLVYVVGTDGTSSTLYAFDGATGKQVAAVPIVGGTTPPSIVISEGKVFIGVNGTITAYAPTS